MWAWINDATGLVAQYPHWALTGAFLAAIVEALAVVGTIIPGTFIVMGVVAVILFQIMVNIGMVVGLMPVTGIPLPLMSYGGSSILFTFLALGIVMNIRMRRFVN